MNKLEIVGDTETIPPHERAAAELKIAETFIDNGPGKPFTFRDGGAEAFTDNNDGTITSKLDSTVVTEAMTRLALSKGAVSFEPTGSQDFIDRAAFTMEQIQGEYDRAQAYNSGPTEDYDDGYTDEARAYMDDEVLGTVAEQRARAVANQNTANNDWEEAQPDDAKATREAAAEFTTSNGTIENLKASGNTPAEDGRAISAMAAAALAERESAEPKKPITFREVENDSMVPLSQGKHEVAPENTVDATEAKAADDEKETKRRNALAKGVVDRYTVNGNRYMVPGADSKEAFRDHGKQIKVKLDDERTVQDVVDLMASRGALSIKVSGTAVLARHTWMAAQKHGIAVTGYKPTAQDIALYQKQKPENTITDTTEQVQQKAPAQAAAPSQMPAARVGKSGELSGKLIEHGAAPYQNDSSNNNSYYLMVESNGEVLTQWGVGLKSAVAKSGVQPGDNIALRKTDAKDVLVKDKKGEEVVGHRADWVIDSPERNELNKAAALRAAAKAVSTKFSEPADRESMVKGMDERIANHQGPLPEVKIRKQVKQDVPVQRETETEQQTL